MSATAYVHLHTLKDGHSNNINTLAFSPTGRYLASGSDDQQVIVWAVVSGRQMYRIGFESRVDALLWNPLWKDTLIIACENGALMQVCNLTLVRCHVSGSLNTPPTRVRRPDTSVMIYFLAFNPTFTPSTITLPRVS